MANIMVLTGSPRVGGNSDMLADAFIQGAEQAGHTVVRFDAGRAKIKGCIACDKCFTADGACVFDDDFNRFAKMLDGVDTLVFVTPIYYYSWPAQIKACIDKLYSFLIGQRPLGIKQSMLITCGEDKDVSRFDGIVTCYEIASAYCGWTDLGHLIAPGVWEKGAIAGSPALDAAREAGRTLRAER